jgi:hypothetical protein
VAKGQERNKWLSCVYDRGVSNAREGSKFLTFLFRTRVVCYLLLHLRSSCKVNSANYFALTAFLEVHMAPVLC